MKKLLITVLLFLTTVFGQADTKLSDSAIETVKDEIARATKAGEIEGGMILVHIHGQQALLDIQGYHDLEDKLEFKEDSLLRVYSMTKPVTSVAAMTLWEAGKFKLEDPVANYIPSFKDVKVGVVVNGEMTHVAPRRPVTIRDLFSHTSGYSYSPAAGTPFGKEYRSRGVFYTHNGMYPPKMSIRKAADQLAQIPLQHQPGERWTYGLSVDILGALIEIWSGQPLEKYMKRAVFKPLGMKDTFFDIPKNKRHRFVSCHTWEGDRQVIIDKWNASDYRDGFEFHSGGGGLVSTIGDYAQFSQMLAGWGQLNGSRILQRTTLEEMFKNQVVSDGGRSFGLGFAIETAKISGAQEPLGQYGWGGYANTEFRVIPEAGVSMVFMRQTVPSTHRMSKKLFGILRSGLTIE
ncbi:MAG: serine hydrolase domain-containing protein [Planctomycetota bacterium]|nr:serine hydrolase domain-containing protein [Planctomycetota bacterium]